MEIIETKHGFMGKCSREEFEKIKEAILKALDEYEQPWIMSKSKKMKYRAVCPLCGKAFDTRKEGFLEPGTNNLICADCANDIRHRTHAPDYIGDSRGKLKKINW